ncbi:MAG: hypothetical protein IPM18_06610 [Phycisphaerales bacterium]|nr:hypothetical protein [Phycisphaerales bacterium]
MSQRILFLAPLSALLLLTACVWPAGNELGRSDLAVAYLDLELTLAAHPPDSTDISRINERFDEASIQFFLGRQADAIQTLRRLTAGLQGFGAPHPERGLITELRGRVEPPTLVRDAPEAVTVQLDGTRMGGLMATSRVTLQLRIRNTDTGTVAHEQPADLEVRALSRPTARIVLPDHVRTLPTGAYVLEIGAAAGWFAPLTRWRVVQESPEAARAQHAELLANVAETPDNRQALASARARNELLVSRPTDSNLTVLLSDMDTLIAAVRAELQTLAAGANPYANLAGDTWRVLATDRGPLPFRVFAGSVADPAKPRPLVIAYHGAGGDENMFFYGYGAGRIRTLAATRNMIVVTPRTELAINQLDHFPALLATLGTDYAIDPQRIYLLGHSLGAATSIELGKRYSENIAAIVCFAGGNNLPNGGAFPATLIYAGTQDPISPISRISRGVEAAQRGGIDVTFERLSGYGHTLAIGDRLAAALDWLLTHTSNTGSGP